MAEPTSGQASGSAPSGASAGGAGEGARPRGVEFGDFEPRVDMLYSNRRPKNFVAGVSSGAKNLGRGIAAGLGVLVGGPVVMGREGGAAGAAKGLVGGVLACVALSAGGALTAARQVAWGAMNTLEYVRETVSGEKVWDENLREWRVVNLEVLTGGIPGDDADLFARGRKARLEKKRKGSGQHAARSSSSSSGASTPEPSGARGASIDAPFGYYTILEVERSASAADIKKAYVRRALQLHPDKNGGNPQATKQFQELNVAYRALANEASRVAYDENGGVAAGAHGPGSGGGSGSHADSSSDEAAHPLQEMLGGHRLAPFIGRLRLAVYMDPSISFDVEMLRTLTERRHVRCAAFLARLLDDHGPNFEYLQQAELPDMLLGVQAAQILMLVAGQYLRVAQATLEGVLSSTRSALTDTMNAAILMGTDATVFAQVARAAFRPSESPSIDTMLSAVLAMARDEIAMTARTASTMALNDAAVTAERRHERAVRLRVLAEVLINAAASAGTAPQLAMLAARGDQPAGAGGQGGAAPTSAPK